MYVNLNTLISCIYIQYIVVGIFHRYHDIYNYNKFILQYSRSVCVNAGVLGGMYLRTQSK